MPVRRDSSSVSSRRPIDEQAPGRQCREIEDEQDAPDRRQRRPMSTASNATRMNRPGGASRNGDNLGPGHHQSTGRAGVMRAGLLFGMVGGPHQRTAGDVVENRARAAGKTLELCRVHETFYRQVAAAGLQGTGRWSADRSRARKSPRTATISSLVSPRPTIRPDLVGTRG